MGATGHVEKFIGLKAKVLAGLWLLLAVDLGRLKHGGVGAVSHRGFCKKPSTPAAYVGNLPVYIVHLSLPVFEKAKWSLFSDQDYKDLGNIEGFLLFKDPPHLRRKKKGPAGHH